jgi:hypothetical protein
MSKRVRISSLFAVAGLGLASLSVSGQSQSAPPLFITAYNGGAPIPYTVPKTPWGDPDLQGVWSSDDTAVSRASARRISATTSISVMKHSLLASSRSSRA